MNILDKIVRHKQQEIATAKSLITLADLEKETYFERECYSLKDFLTHPDKTGIIAEFKRQSPSKGIINAHSSVEEVTQGYAKAGASALSVLSDTHFFGGYAQDVKTARAHNDIPILRKDFILDAYQLYEAKAWGADVILLIAAILNPEEIEKLAKKAKHLGLSVLLEVHNKAELERSLCAYIDAVGVNNRNLADFKVDIQTSFDLADLIPKEFVKVSESAIAMPQTLKDLKAAGFEGFLIGENFMREKYPDQAMQAFVDLL